MDLRSDKTIDPCVIHLANGTWRMWYKDEQKPKPLSYADSPDLYHGQTKSNAVTNFSGEGPKVIHWKGSYGLLPTAGRLACACGNRMIASKRKLQDEPCSGRTATW